MMCSISGVHFTRVPLFKLYAQSEGVSVCLTMTEGTKINLSARGLPLCRPDSHAVGLLSAFYPRLTDSINQVASSDACFSGVNFRQVEGRFFAVTRNWLKQAVQLVIAVDSYGKLFCISQQSLINNQEYMDE